MPPVPGQQSNLPLFIHIQRDEIVLYRDMSGQSLHNRGYRGPMHRASLNAAAAAGILIMAGWSDLSGEAGMFHLHSYPSPMLHSVGKWGTPLPHAIAAHA